MTFIEALRVEDKPLKIISYAPYMELQHEHIILSTLVAVELCMSLILGHTVITGVYYS